MGWSRREVVAGGIGSSLLAGPSIGAHPLGLTTDQAVIDRTRIAQNAPGLAIAVSRRGRQIASLVSGRASIGLNVPVTDRTLFHLGSVGKHITAVAVLRLVAAGKLSLDAPIGRYAPRIPANLADRSLRSLLDHTSGFPDYSPSIEWDRPFDRDTFYRLMDAYPAEFAGGTAWNYSNAAYVLLGYVIEDIAGKNYARIVREDLFAQAGLSNSQVDDAELPIADRAEPYAWRRDQHVHATRMSSTVSSVAAGGVLMSIRDAAAWTGALHGGVLLPAGLLAEMSRPARLTTGLEIPYGLGWMRDLMPNGGSILYHGGSVPGFRTMHVHIPHKALSVMAVTNSDTLAASVAGWEIAERHAPGSTPLSLPVLADASPESTGQARQIVTRAGKLAPSLFAPEMQLHLAAGRDHVVPRFTPEQSKALRAFELVQVDRNADGTARRRYRATFADHSRHVAVHHLDDGRIFFMRIQ